MVRQRRTTRRVMPQLARLRGVFGGAGDERRGSTRATARPAAGRRGRDVGAGSRRDPGALRDDVVGAGGDQLVRDLPARRSPPAVPPPHLARLAQREHLLADGAARRVARASGERVVQFAGSGAGAASGRAGEPRARQLIERRARLALTLRQFSERAIAIADADALHRIILETALGLSGADRGLLSRVDGAGTLVFAGIGCCERLVGQVVPLADRYVAESIARSEPLVIDDVAAMEPASPVAAAAQRHATEQLMILTMRHDETPIGQVMVGTAAARDWGDEEIEAMRTLASMAAELMERGRIQAARDLERRRLGESIEHLPIGVAVIDPTGRALHINGAARALAEALGITYENWRESMARLRKANGEPLKPEDSMMLRAFRGEHPPAHVIRF